MQHLMCLLSAQSSWTSHTRAGAIGLQTGFKNSWSDCLTSKHSPGRSQLLLCMQGVLQQETGLPLPDDWPEDSPSSTRPGPSRSFRGPPHELAGRAQLQPL